MQKKKFIPPQPVSFSKKIKVKLDHKTTIIINRLSSLAVWKKLYPLAEIVQ
jgi:hypothetical protein